MWENDILIFAGGSMYVVMCEGSPLGLLADAARSVDLIRAMTV